MNTEIFSLYWWVSVVVVGLLLNLGSAYIKPVIDAFLRYLSLSSLNRQIRQAEGELAHLDKLAKSEKSILLFGFSGLFAMVGVVILIFAIQTLVSHDNELTRISVALLSILAAVGCIYLAKLFKRLYDYPESREEIEKRITTLKSKLPGGSG